MKFSIEELKNLMPGDWLIVETLNIIYYRITKNNNTISYNLTRGYFFLLINNEVYKFYSNLDEAKVFYKERIKLGNFQ